VPKPVDLNATVLHEAHQQLHTFRLRHSTKVRSVRGQVAAGNQHVWHVLLKSAGDVAASPLRSHYPKGVGRFESRGNVRFRETAAAADQRDVEKRFIVGRMFNVDRVVLDEHKRSFVLPIEGCCPVQNRETKPISHLLATHKRGDQSNANTIQVFVFEMPQCLPARQKHRNNLPAGLLKKNPTLQKKAGWVTLRCTVFGSADPNNRHGCAPLLGLQGT
jgi:hypothetical protein